MMCKIIFYFLHYKYIDTNSTSFCVFFSMCVYKKHLFWVAKNLWRFSADDQRNVGNIGFHCGSVDKKGTCPQGQDHILFLLGGSARSEHVRGSQPSTTQPPPNNPDDGEALFCSH